MASDKNAEVLVQRWLLASSEVDAVVANRVALELLPQNTQYPAIVFNVISDVPDPWVDYQNGPQLSKARVQFNPLAATAVAVISIAEALRLTLDFKHNVMVGDIKVMSSRLESRGAYSRDEATGLWTRPLDYRIEYYQ